MNNPLVAVVYICDVYQSPLIPLIFPAVLVSWKTVMGNIVKEYKDKNIFSCNYYLTMNQKFAIMWLISD